MRAASPKVPQLVDLPSDERRSIVDQAWQCAHVARAAYEDAEALEAAGAAAGLSLVEQLTRATNVGVVFDGPDVRIIGFRGTDERRDWLTSLNILWRRSPWGLVHRGFWDAASSFAPEVDAQVREARAQGRPIWLTGHSLGGALAVMTAARLLAGDPSLVAGLCTFGQPPVAGLRFGHHCEEALGRHYLRLVNHTDSVVDMSSLTASHCGWLWYFDTGGRLYHTKPFKVGVTDQWKANKQLGGLYMFAAHGLDLYFEPLRKLR